jgi:glycosyltransferase involved in cell wall biosynthesis
MDIAASRAQESPVGREWQTNHAQGGQLRMNELESPELSVLICTRNRPEKLKRAVASVLANSVSSFELIVVDQSTDQLSAEVMASFGDGRIRYLQTPTVGLAISRNIAIRAARADTLVFTDDDCVCDREWLAAIQAEYAREPTALGVYGRVVPYGNRDDIRSNTVGVSGDLICPAVNNSSERRVFDRPAIPQRELGGGNNMSFRKEVFSKVGVFIETLGSGSPMGAGEDTEFSYRLLWHRCKVVYSPRPLVHHDNWVDRSQFTRMMKVSVRGEAAVFLSYALRLDRFALVHLVRTAWHVVGNRLAIGSVTAGLAYFAMGLALGPRYRLMKPPRLQAYA